MTHRLIALAAALLLASSLPGCFLRPRPDRTRYYTLASSNAEVPMQVASDLIVGLGPVSLPGYLGRPSLVTRLDVTRIEYAELARWAEPLRQAVHPHAERGPVRSHSAGRRCSTSPGGPPSR